jgi:hypothetical protein
MDKSTIYISQTEVAFSFPHDLVWETARFMVAHTRMSLYGRYMNMLYAFSNEGVLYLKPNKLVNSIEFDQLFRFYTGAPDYDPKRVIKVCG